MAIEYSEGYPYLGVFIKSPIDGEIYCRKNGDFLRHLVTNDVASYADLIHKMHPELVTFCSCGARNSFSRSRMEFLTCCGSDECTIIARRDALRSRSIEQKTQHIASIKQAKLNTPKAIKYLHQQQRIATGTARGSYKKSVIKRELTCQALYGDKKYNNSEKISNTKQNWTDEQRRQFLDNLTKAFGGRWMNDFTTSETWQKRRKKLEALGKVVPFELLSEWKQYSYTARTLTERNYRSNKHTINPNNYTRATSGDGYHLDHIMPVIYGFCNDIPPEEIAAVNNLQMLPWRDNISKGGKYDPNSTQ